MPGCPDTRLILSVKKDILSPIMNIDSIFQEGNMWERIMDAGLLVIGTVILFAAFTAILFVYERKEQKNKEACRPQLRVIRCEKTDRAA